MINQLLLKLSVGNIMIPLYFLKKQSVFTKEDKNYPQLAFDNHKVIVNSPRVIRFHMPRLQTWNKHCLFLLAILSICYFCRKGKSDDLPLQGEGRPAGCNVAF
jgi:hypothetical protein